MFWNVVKAREMGDMYFMCFHGASLNSCDGTRYMKAQESRRMSHDTILCAVNVRAFITSPDLLTCVPTGYMTVWWSVFSIRSAAGLQPLLNLRTYSTASLEQKCDNQPSLNAHQIGSVQWNMNVWKYLNQIFLTMQLLKCILIVMFCDCVRLLIH